VKRQFQFAAGARISRVGWDLPSNVTTKEWADRRETARRKSDKLLDNQTAEFLQHSRPQHATGAVARYCRDPLPLPQMNQILKRHKGRPKRLFLAAAWFTTRVKDSANFQRAHEQLRWS
jgi:hypothetical protein